jgi:hypothetical protein
LVFLLLLADELLVVLLTLIGDVATFFDDVLEGEWPITTGGGIMLFRLPLPPIELELLGL